MTRDEVIAEMFAEMFPIFLMTMTAVIMFGLFVWFFQKVMALGTEKKEEPEVSTLEGQKTRGRVAEMLAVRGCRPCRGSYTCWDSANCRLSAETRDHYGIVLLSDEESS